MIIIIVTIIVIIVTRQRSAFFDVRVCHPNADFYRDLDPDQIFRQHETEKKRQSLAMC